MNDDAFSVTVRPVAAGAVLAIRGDLDTHTATEVLAAISGLPLGTGQLLVVDLAGMRFCDSSGISAFIAARNAAATADAETVLAGVPRQVLRVLRMIGLDAFFPIHASVEDALAAHRPGSG